MLISDLAPMDLLLQRMGRLHRHDETKRPDKHKSPILYIMGMNDTLEFEEGSSFVYGDFLLARTQYYLPKVIRMPEESSSPCTGSNTIAATCSAGEASINN